MFADLLAAIEVPAEGTPTSTEQNDGDASGAEAMPQLATAPPEAPAQPQLQPAQPLATFSVTRPVLWMVDAETSEAAGGTPQA